MTITLKDQVPKFERLELETTSFEPCDFAKMINELSNPRSIWHQVKLAEMPSKDYIFLPWQISSQLRDLYAIEEFVNNLQTFLNSDPKRTLLVAFNELAPGQLTFEKMSVFWSEHVAINWKREHIPSHSNEFEFMCMLYEHSEALMP